MKTITEQQFQQSIERGKNVIIKPFKPYVSKVEQVRKQDPAKVSALQASIERGKSC